MTILLDHLIVPSHDQVAAARFLADLLGVPWEERNGHFSPVYVNDTLTLDFGDWEQFEGHHYGFHVSDAEFNQISSASKPPAWPTAAIPGISTTGRWPRRSAARMCTGRMPMATRGSCSP